MMSVIGPVTLSWGSPVGRRKEGFVEKVGFAMSLEWKSEGVMDDENGDDERDGLTSGWGGESRQDGEADGMNLEVDSKDKVMRI